MQVTSGNIIKIAVFGWFIFLLGGGLDLVKSFTGGLENAELIRNPIISALSPVAMMAMGFGTLGLLLVYWSSRNRKSNSKLSDKQLLAGFIIAWVIYAVLEFTFRFGMKV